jgi:hypothetical protein
MRMVRVQFQLRWLMVAIAFLAIILSISAGMTAFLVFLFTILGFILLVPAVADDQRPIASLADGWTTRSNRSLWVMATRAGRGRRWVMLDEDLQDFTPLRKSAGARSTCFRLAAHAIARGVFLAFLVFATGWVEPIFADFGVPLPNVTIWVIEASHRVVASVSLTLLLLAADGLVLDALCRRGDVLRAWSWSLMMIATPLSMIAVTLWALLLPLLTTCPMRLSG